MKSKGIWEVKPVGECYEIIGKPPVSIRWAITNRGSPGEMKVRSRLVARDFKGETQDETTYLLLPLHEAEKALISRAASQLGVPRELTRKISRKDISKGILPCPCDPG